MSIVESLLEAVQHEQRLYPDAQVMIVRVRVGQLRQVIPETLKFCYAAATRGTPLAGSQLEIEPVAAVGQCRRCELEFSVEEHLFACPQCQGLDARLRRGNELELLSIELEESLLRSETTEGGRST